MLRSVDASGEFAAVHAEWVSRMGDYAFGISVSDYEWENES
jgi:hypothetical protein